VCERRILHRSFPSSPLCSRPVARTPFIRALDSTFDTLAAAADNRVGVPAYFKFLTLLGLRCFLDAGVDVAILEVGIGGRLDATNVCPPPVVAGIAPLGFDHMDLLGDTLPAIATQKAGIFKPGSRAFTVPQRVDAAETLAVSSFMREGGREEGGRKNRTSCTHALVFPPPQERAAAVNIPLSLAASLADYKAPGGGPGDALPLGLRGAHQATNASLAVALAGAFDGWAAAHPGSLPSGAAPPGAADRAAALARGELPAEYAAGLATCAWHGRAEVVHDPASPPSALSFYLDGAHTPESMETCAHWFASECGKGVGGAGGAASPPAEAAVSPPSSPSSPDSELRLLLFNCMHERDPRRLLTPLTDTLRARGAPLAGAVFVPPDSSYASLGPAEEAKVDLSWQASLQAVWADLAASAGRAGGAGGAGGAAAAAVGPPLRLPLLPPSPPRAAAAAVAASTAAAKAASAAAQHQDAAAGAVSPSVKSAIEWLRSASRARPGVRLRVLVTGSLYLVGDVLRHLGRAEEGGE